MKHLGICVICHGILLPLDINIKAKCTICNIEYTRNLDINELISHVRVNKKIRFNCKFCNKTHILQPVGLNEDESVLVYCENSDDFFDLYLNELLKNMESNFNQVQKLNF